MLLATAGGACDEVAVDDYRESAAIIQGSVNELGGPVISGAVLEFTPDTPAYLFGDTVTTDAGGTFRARVTSFGVGTFIASVRLQARRSADSPVALDTLLQDLRVVEDREGAQPDTLRLAIALSPP